MRFTTAAATLLVGAVLVKAHREKATPEELAALQDLKAASYLCAPAVAQYTAARQRSWAQKVLGGSPVADKNLFIEGAWDDSLVGGADAGKKVLECTERHVSKIKNHTCVLAPEVTQGPYYHTEGHPIRSNMAELEPGLLFLMNIGVIDVNTCEPIPNILVDVWHANATGHYAGHPDPAPHLTNEQPQVGGKRSGLLSAFPRTNDEQTFLRGALPTDQNGVAEFTTVFPGYYTGRATHVHAKIHPKWTVLPNNTFVSGQMAHTGQFFVPDDINVAIDKLWPYNTNPIAEIRGRTRNWRDSLNIFEDSQEGGYQSTFDVQFLGGVLQQGLIGYITVVINGTADYGQQKWSP